MLGILKASSKRSGLPAELETRSEPGNQAAQPSHFVELLTVFHRNDLGAICISLSQFASFTKDFHRMEWERKSTKSCFFAKIPLVFQRKAFLAFPTKSYRNSLEFLTVFHRMWLRANLWSENADFAVFLIVFHRNAMAGNSVLIRLISLSR